MAQTKALVKTDGEQTTHVIEQHYHGVDDTGTEPEDDSLPPDGVDIIWEQDRKAGRPLTPLEDITNERHRRCLELRTAGLTYRAIAEQMGYATHSAAYNACQRARKELKAPDESAPELRSMLYNQMRDAFQRIWPLALGGYKLANGQTAPPSLEHMKECRALMAAMADLMGAKAAAPTQHHTVSGDVQVGGAIVHAHGHALIDEPWDEERFIAEMRRNTTEGLMEAMGGTVHEIKPPSGYIAPQHNDEQFEDTEVIEANVVTEAGESVFDPRKAITFD